MDKKTAHKIIQQSAKLYNQNLLNNNYLIVYSLKNTNNKLEYIEVVFNKHNFSHLTGVQLNNIHSK